MATLPHFEAFRRADWQQLYKGKLPPLTQAELAAITSINDDISLTDVSDIYLPLVHYIRIYKRKLDDLALARGLFVQKITDTPPLIIGISGSVAVGKSTVARLMQLLLSRVFKRLQVELVTTDGFLYPNEVLKAKGIMHRKGFPESYDQQALIHFLDTIKSGSDAEVPVYSHETYDILPDKQPIDAPDILIVEGINVLQNPSNHQLYLSDFYDFSIYVDADETDIERWYLGRIQSFLELAKHDDKNYYHQFIDWPLEEVVALAKNTWQTINLPNLRDFIAPTMHRADVIVHKASNHQVDCIYLKRF